PRVLRRGEPGRAMEGLRRGLADPDFGVRRQCARTRAHLSERDPTLAIPSTAVFEAVVQELARGPEDWTEIAEPEGSDDPPGRAPQTPRARGLAHVFTLLALVLEREPLRIAYVAVLGEDTALRGTALEYLENVLPDDVRRGLWPHLRLPARPVASGRTRQNLVQELMRAGPSVPRR
ncbi:MAG TPA: hypothetical protein VGQ33_06290, partial [Vicinamibacteria bacterium]|nr:hypothetical protein [Vicinamibacteria bacterium]